MLGGPGAGTNAGFWSRRDGERVGVWAMELIHGLTGFGELYPFGGDMSGFDEMACSCGTHLSAYTKAAIGWLDRGAIAAQNGCLHDTSCTRSAWPSRRRQGARRRCDWHACRTRWSKRQRVDPFDADPQRGAIVYRVQTVDPSWATPRTARPRWIC